MTYILYDKMIYGSTKVTRTMVRVILQLTVRVGVVPVVFLHVFFAGR